MNINWNDKLPSENKMTNSTLSIIFLHPHFIDELTKYSEWNSLAVNVFEREKAVR